MLLNKDILFSQEQLNYDSTLNGTSVKGTYNTMQFVLRLRDDIRTALNSKEIDPISIQASSTAVHENIHWWQHMGSNFGFLFSLAYPSFIHFSYDSFLKIVKSSNAYKSILKFDKQYYAANNKADIEHINVILNNYHDIEYAKLIALDNKNIEGIIKDRRFFLNIGHCYFIFWVSTLHTLSATLDRENDILPNTNNWVKHFEKLTKDKSEGFYIGSPIHISPLGIKAIYEGQAMFNQIQYLLRNLNPELTYTDFENAGMLHGIYIEAFELFLQVTNLDKPINLLDSTVGLFLLVCDLAINPTNGFPLDIYDFKGFIAKNDPGIRFILLCSVISKKPNYFINKITSYSKDEYISLSKELSEIIGCECPYESIATVLSWEKQSMVSDILKEEIDLKYSDENLPIRLMFSKYYRFQEDKQKYPNILCWFGYHAYSKNPDVQFEIIDSLYQKHHALFMDDFDGEIKPTIFSGRKEENIMSSFNQFYAFNIIYDLAMKWVYEEGEFKFDYKWLAGERAQTFTPVIKNNFFHQFGIDIDSIKIV